MVLLTLTGCQVKLYKRIHEFLDEFKGMETEQEALFINYMLLWGVLNVNNNIQGFSI